MLTDITGIRVGHVTDSVNLTGCSVAVFDKPAVVGASQRGGNSVSIYMDYFRPGTIAPSINAVMLTGGSSFGLEAALGAMKYFEEKKLGIDVGVTNIPLVPAAVIYDLSVGNAHVRPDLKMGYQVCEAARDGPFDTGPVGAGTGATIGKFYGATYASPGGIGTATVHLYGGIMVSAMVVVNSFGDLVDPVTHDILAGTHDIAGNFLNTLTLMKSGLQSPYFVAKQNTTIGIVSTNCQLTRTEANRLAELAHNGLAQVIHPIHTNVDGDTLFASGWKESDKTAPMDVLGVAAVEAVAKACLNAVRPKEA